MSENFPNMPARNPWLTDSVYPMTHFNPGMTDSVLHAGPTMGKKLSRHDVKVAPEVVSVSNPTIKKIGGETIVLASGVAGIAKIRATGQAFETISFTPYPGLEAVAARGTLQAVEAVVREADAARRAKDDDALLAVSRKMDELGLNWQNLANGISNAIDCDGFHYCLYGGVNILKSTDDNDLSRPMRAVASVKVTDQVPPEVARRVSRLLVLGITYDGHIVAVAPSTLIVFNRDLKALDFMSFPGEFVDNGIAIDERNGIYLVTSIKMRRIAWTGKRLSMSEKDGAWETDYNTMNPRTALKRGALSRGSGTTPTLMGFGNDPDKLVVIADADPKGANLVAFWCDGIPGYSEKKPGVKSRRIAGQIRIDISELTIETSPNVLGYGVAVINGTYPKPAQDIFGNAMTSGVTRPAPLGIQKFNWNPNEHRFEKAWINREIDNTDQIIPVISARTNLLYAGHKVNGDYQYVALDWNTGKVAARWIFPDDSRLWNAFGGVTTILEDGDLMIGGFFGAKRMNISDGEPNRNAQWVVTS